jgi:SAM-dependent methyltransferase
VSGYSNEELYELLDEPAERSARVVCPLVMALLDVQSVVDVGCGLGRWLAVFRALGVHDVVGVERPEEDPERIQLPPESLVQADLGRPLRLSRRFDLALCLEVANHLPQAAAPTLIETLATLAPAVLFSAAVPYQGGPHHLNCQWPAYWAKLFEEQGFAACDCLRAQIWENADVSWWYRQNVLLFVQRDQLERHPRLSAQSGPPLPLVHPENYLEQVDGGA